MTYESEKITRKKRIDKQLKASGWLIIPYSEGMDLTILTNHAIEELQTNSGPADYALVVNGKLLGVVEAKKLEVGAANVLEQAKRYSKGANKTVGEWNEYRVPFLYSSNGELIYYLDARDSKNLSRQIYSFHTPEAMETLFNSNKETALQWLKEKPINTPGLRPYQKEAIQAFENNLEERKRLMLLAMATGTGKTFTTVNLVYRMLASGYAKRILFLVDRKSLAAQAVTAFASFDTPRNIKFKDEYELYSQRFKKEDFEGEAYDPTVLPNSYLTNPDGTKTFLYICTIQRMAINLYGKAGAFGENEENEDDAEKLSIPSHAFDLIIADECHRGYTSKETNVWRNVLNHFDAVKVGLTATPASHTVAYFNKPIFNYSLQQAIEEGYLVDYDAVAINSEVLMNGAFLKEGEQVGMIDTETGREQIDQLEDEREFTSTEIEEKITAPDTNQKIVEELKKYTDEWEKRTGRFPKTLIFASNDIPMISHADRLVSICKSVFNRGDDFVAKITGSPTVDRPLKKIKEFRNRPNPKIVVTVDMLSTGVDIPSIEFIVFLRPVKSRILWEQMLGRGTRKCDEIGKTHFVIFDCFNGTLIKYFKDASYNFKIDPPGTETITIKELIEKIYNNEDRKANAKRLAKRLHRIEKDMSGNARDKFATYIPNGDMGKFAELLAKFFEKYK
ncbi:MAG: DEAD/DEAH box helicase family protein [Paludibacteraceae bacterium]|nr:DEAD/DEAH box helicase family protein [Paludibacteraceae bacterium]HOF99227.1 DEAD/DEAH box helicase family protein [Paludibacteraceae bacterium]HOJ65824.1 DEAD/DEAH box helicase family protein [Paludibacteraceae bacterium]HOR38496.1 DEAD/DEAH box helicase family protein [Paludibacteraceae bacterium]HPQ12519.1 DEAD/DEAH box helicase family protein [Paludibacteraceae bacterium]